MNGTPPTLELAARLGRALTERKLSLAVAESCTGGMLGAAITDVPGSSRYFLGGVISYADRVKLEQLGVPAETLSGQGAVSAETARAMATGVKRLLQADIGVSITGVAGPVAEGPKPAGLTFIGVAIGDSVQAHSYQWSGDRRQNREESVLAALKLALEATEYKS